LINKIFLPFISYRSARPLYRETQLWLPHLPTREAMANAMSGELILPQYPNRNLFIVVRMKYFIFVVMHVYLLPPFALPV
jgi:hypothetical protein